HLVRRGNFELPLGFNLKELIYDVCGGIPDGRKLKAVIPGGSSVPILSADEIDIPMDYESVARAGSMLGTASVIVMDDRTNIVKTVRRIVEFYAHESCGQCTPCREGTAWLVKILRRIESGQGTEADLDTLLDLGRNMTGTTICVLSDSAAAPVASSIKKFREEYLALIRGGKGSAATVAACTITIRSGRRVRPAERRRRGTGWQPTNRRTRSPVRSTAVRSRSRKARASSRRPSSSAWASRTTATIRRSRLRPCAACAWSRSRVRRS